MTSRVRERLRRYVAGFVREETALRDGSQKTKTLVEVAEGSIEPEAVGNTRAPRIAEPASTPADARGA